MKEDQRLRETVTSAKGGAGPVRNTRVLVPPADVDT